jgi:NAD(P)-dependent dehydrogenase (short-subunit alcohol dehydrogenase family)
MKALEGRVAIITGASSGIGRSTARLFAAEGASVVLGARRRAELESLAGALSSSDRRAVALAGDVRDESFAQALTEVAIGNFGQLDIAVNCAGIMGVPCATPELGESDWNDIIATNLTGAFLGAKHQLPHLVSSGRGSLIFVSSFVGCTIGFPGMAAYAASKAGLVGMTRALAAEYGTQEPIRPWAEALRTRRRFCHTCKACTR